MTAETEQLVVETEERGQDVVLHLDGELDPHTAPVLQEAIDAWSAKGTPRIFLDLRQLRFIDSSGLRVVIGAHRQLSEAGAELVLINVSPTAARLLEITGLSSHLSIESDGTP